MTAELIDLNSVPGLVITPPTTSESRRSLLIFGKMKSGKSTLAATAADVVEMSPVLWFAAEDGTASFGDKYGDKIDVVRPSSAQQILQLVRQLTEKDDKGELLRPTKYKTLVLDTVGAYQKTIQREHIAKNGSGDYSMWGDIGSWPTEIVEKIHNSPYNLIVIAHHEKVKDDVEGKLLVMPHMMGKQAIVDIPPIVDGVFYLAKVEDKEGKPLRVLQTQGTSRTEAGSRYEDKLPAQIENPTMTKIVDFLNK